MDDPQRPHGGFADLVGYRLGTWREDYAEVLLEVAPEHLNRSGVLHGGVLTTILDAACGYAGTHCSVPGNVRRGFTLSLNSHFIGTAGIGQLLICAARKTGGGRTIFFSSAEVRDDDGRLVAQGEGVFRYRRGSEIPEGTAPQAETEVALAEEARAQREAERS